MHDLVHDLACSITRDECFSVVTVGDKELVVARRNTTRHLAIKQNILFSPNFSLSMFQTFLRTLFQLDMYNTGVPPPPPLNFSNLIYLRVLDLSGSVHLETLPESIARLKLLRYLDLSQTPIALLSDEVFGNLINLQTLKLIECNNLEMLPGNMRKLTNLRHLDITRSTGKLLGMPVGMGQLKCLHKLSDFIVSEESGCGVGELGELDHLEGSIEISCLWKVKDVRDAENAKLSRKENIRVLRLDWLKRRNATAESQISSMNAKLIADALQPHPNTVSLVFDGYGGSDFPKWMNSTCMFSLVKLEIGYCSKCKHLPTLGLLAHLKQLYLSCIPVECIGNEFYCDEEEDNNMMKAARGIVLFPALEELQLYGMRSLEEWKGWSLSSRRKKGEAQVSVFPALESLSIQDCQKLTSLPDDFQNLVSLQFLHIERCDGLKSSLKSLSLQHLTNLHDLKISYCGELELLPDYFQNLVSLQSLHLEVLPNLPEGIFQNLTSLKELKIESCDGFKSLSLQHLTNLHELTIGDCLELELLPDDFQNLVSLQTLHFKDLPNLQEGILQNLTSLKELTIESCDGLKSLNNCLQHLTNLHELTITNCGELELLPDDFQNLVSLRSLFLHALPKLAVVPVVLGSTLTVISFLSCDCLTNLPEWITNQKSLWSLVLYGCKNLKSLSEGLQHLTALRQLRITDCHPELHRRCQKNTGEDWHKIAHIPELVIS